MLIRTTWNFDFDFSLSLCVFIEMVNNHFKIIFSHYCCHMNSSFVLSYYNTTQNMYDTYFLSIEFSSLLLVMSWIQCVSTWQYAPNTKKLNHHKIRLRNVENWSIVGWYQKYLPTFYQNAPKFSPQLWHFSPQVQKRYNYVTKRTRKSIKNLFLFSIQW